MSSEITVPALGESIVEATVGRWLKQPDDAVMIGDPLVELETEKVNMEIAATVTGVLKSILKSEGEVVGIGDVLGIISHESKSATKPSESRAGTSASLPRSEPASTVETNSAGGHPSSATPIARRMATEHGVDLQLITGSGTRGQITQEDVNAYINDPITLKTGNTTTAGSAMEVAPAVPPERSEERVRLSRRRQTIARRLVEAQRSAAMLTTFNEVDMSAVVELRRRHRDSFKERYAISLGFMSFFTRAVTSALKAYPRLNATIQDDLMILKRYYDIGIAVGVEEGLVVPVLRNADKMSFAEIELQISDLATRAHKNTLTLEELRGGTFTITNGGTFGSLLSTPILNAPQVGILGMHKIEDRPIAWSGQVVIHPMMYVALSYDHRIVDGSEAVRFLVRIKELIEDPSAMLLEV